MGGLQSIKIFICISLVLILSTSVCTLHTDHTKVLYNYGVKFEYINSFYPTCGIWVQNFQIPIPEEEFNYAFTKYFDNTTRVVGETSQQRQRNCWSNCLEGTFRPFLAYLRPQLCIQYQRYIKILLKIGSESHTTLNHMVKSG